MKEIVTNYLNKNYRVSPETTERFILYDKVHNNTESLHSVFKSIKKIFGIDDAELETIVNPWIDAKLTEYNNKIVDLQFKIYEANNTPSI